MTEGTTPNFTELGALKQRAVMLKSQGHTHKQIAARLRHEFGSSTRKKLLTPGFKEAVNSQLLLLSAPVFGDSAIYILFPPNMGSSPFKIVLITVLTVVFGLFAIRIKDKILLHWLIILSRERFFRKA